MQIIKKMGDIITILLICLLGIYIVLMNTVPEKVSVFLGFRLCNILTGSMEPLIPTNSLVIVKNLGQHEYIKPGTIITFRADRFHEDILITHYFDHVEEDNEGRNMYRTYAYGVSDLDDYETRRDDILGTYVKHIPYLGNLVLFLQSSIAFIMYGVLLAIFIIYRLCSLYLDKQEEEQRALDMENDEEERLNFYHMQHRIFETLATISGYVCYSKIENLKKTVAKIKFYDAYHCVINEYSLHLYPYQEDNIYYWRCTYRNDERIDYYVLYIGKKMIPKKYELETKVRKEK